VTGRAEKELREFEVVFKALAHASRRNILVILNARGGQMTAGEIMKRFSCSWPTTSRHLRILEASGLVAVTKQGREWLYVLQKEKLQIVTSWLKWFDQ